MAEHGGYRRPSNPAPASGPGKLAKRTDGGPAQKLQSYSDQPYGQGQATTAQEQGAAMSQQDNIPGLSLPQGQQQDGGSQGDGQGVIPFDAPTQRPDEPITSGADIGPGPGPEALGAPPASQGDGSMTALLMRLAPTSVSGALGQLLQAAQSRNA